MSEKIIPEGQRKVQNDKPVQHQNQFSFIGIKRAFSLSLFPVFPYVKTSWLEEEKGGRESPHVSRRKTNSPEG